MKLNVNDTAPDFSLVDQEDRLHTLSDYKGKWVLLYFYPKDDSAGCTTEACGVRDNLPDFDKLDAVVLGVSADSVESHKKFARKYNLQFILLADETKETIKNYDAWGRKKIYGKQFDGILRTSFLINPEGKIAKIYERVSPEKHALQVLDDLKQLQNPAK